MSKVKRNILKQKSKYYRQIRSASDPHSDSIRKAGHPQKGATQCTQCVIEEIRKDLIKGPVRNNRFQSSHRGPEADLKSLKNRQVIIRCRHRKNAKWNGASFKIRKISYSSSYFKMFRLHNLLFNLELHNFIWKSSMLFYQQQKYLGIYRYL